MPSRRKRVHYPCPGSTDPWTSAGITAETRLAASSGSPVLRRPVVIPLTPRPARTEARAHGRGRLSRGASRASPVRRPRPVPRPGPGPRPVSRGRGPPPGRQACRTHSGCGEDLHRRRPETPGERDGSGYSSGRPSRHVARGGSRTRRRLSPAGGRARHRRPGARPARRRSGAEEGAGAPVARPGPRGPSPRRRGQARARCRLRPRGARPHRGLTEEGTRQGPGGRAGAQESPGSLGEPRGGGSTAERPSRLAARLTGGRTTLTAPEGRGGQRGQPVPPPQSLHQQLPNRRALGPESPATPPLVVMVRQGTTQGFEICCRMPDEASG